MKKRLNLSLVSTLATALVALSTAGYGAAFTAGNLVVLRVGDGTRALSAAAEAMFLDEYQPNGTFVQTVSLPTTNSSPQLGVTLDGTQLAVGAVNRSTDGQYLTLGGYNAAVATASVSGTTSAASPRVIIRVAGDGTVDTSTAVTDGHSAGRFAGVTTDDGTHFWTCGTGGATGGVRYMATFGSATTTTQVVSSPNNVLFPSIFSGQLYASLAFNPPPTGTGRGVCTIGTGLPTGTGQTVTILPGFPTSGSASPKSYHIADANTIFIADSNSFATGGGLQKWTFNGSTWSQVSGFPVSSGVGAGGLMGLTATISGLNVDIYATTSDTTAGNAIVKWSSVDGGSTGTMSTIVAAPLNPGGANFSAFRGIAFSPVAVSAVNNWAEFPE